MRTVLAFFAGILCAAIVAAISAITVENTQPQQVTVLGTTLQGSAGWGLAAATALGFVLALFLLLPGRMATGGRGGSLRRRSDALEAELRTLQASYAQLLASHQQLLAEHQQVMRALLAANPSGQPAAPSAPSAPSAPTPSPEDARTEAVVASRS